MTTNATTRWNCTECARLSWPGYCAPLRCYCGHPDCHAYASWQPYRQLYVVPDVLPTKGATP